MVFSPHLFWVMDGRCIHTHPPPAYHQVMTNVVQLREKKLVPQSGDQLPYYPYCFQYRRLHFFHYIQGSSNNSNCNFGRFFFSYIFSLAKLMSHLVLRSKRTYQLRRLHLGSDRFTAGHTASSIILHLRIVFKFLLFLATFIAYADLCSISPVLDAYLIRVWHVPFLALAVLTGSSLLGSLVGQSGAFVRSTDK